MQENNPDNTEVLHEMRLQVIAHVIFSSFVPRIAKTQNMLQHYYSCECLRKRNDVIYDYTYKTDETGVLTNLHVHAFPNMGIHSIMYTKGHPYNSNMNVIKILFSQTSYNLHMSHRSLL